jgi:hypothetical protein
MFYKSYELTEEMSSKIYLAFKSSQVNNPWHLVGIYSRMEPEKSIISANFEKIIEIYENATGNRFK